MKTQLAHISPWSWQADTHLNSNWIANESQNFLSFLDFLFISFREVATAFPVLQFV